MQLAASPWEVIHETPAELWRQRVDSKDAAKTNPPCQLHSFFEPSPAPNFFWYRFQHRHFQKEKTSEPEEVSTPEGKVSKPEGRFLPALSPLRRCFLGPVMWPGIRLLPPCRGLSSKIYMPFIFWITELLEELWMLWIFPMVGEGENRYKSSHNCVHAIWVSEMPHMNSSLDPQLRKVVDRKQIKSLHLQCLHWNTSLYGSGVFISQCRPHQHAAPEL